MKPRSELIKEYLKLYYDRCSYNKNNSRMSDIWIGLTLKERQIINKHITTDMLF